MIIIIVFILFFAVVVGGGFGCCSGCYCLQFRNSYSPCLCAVTSDVTDPECPDLRSCVTAEVAVLGSPSLINLMVCVGVKQH